MSAKVAFDSIKNLLGPGGFIDEASAMESYLTAWRNGWQGKAAFIALPYTTAHVCELVKFCAQNKIGIVPQGGNTGLVGGSIPSSAGDQIVVNLSRINRIRDIDAIGSTVTAEAGVVLQTLQEAAANVGFLFPLSMGSQGSAQIGGVISTNAGGTAVLRYGNMRELVLGIEAVLPNGDIFSGLKSLRKDNMGYNLGQYFVGAEGTLGIVTAATLKLFPKPQQSLTAIAGIPDAEAGLELLGDFRKVCSEYLNAFEIMSQTAVNLAVKNIANVRTPGGPAPYYLLIELEAASKDAPLGAMFESVAAKAIEDGCISDAVVASSIAQAKQFWHLREHISEALRKEGPGIHFDISLPLAAIADFLMQMEPRIKSIAPDIQLAPFGHIGDGNLHYNMCFAKAPENFAAIKKQIQDLVYGAVIKCRGSISAEHGIGIERKAELQRYKSPAEIEMMKKIKGALDPAGIMNPGKIFD